jgi:tetratricopeptide (TPR) repeat protein
VVGLLSARCADTQSVSRVQSIRRRPISPGGVLSSPEAKPTLEQLDQHLKAAQSAGDPWKQGIALNNLGTYYKERRETAKAAKFFVKALEFFSVLQDLERKATVLNNLGGTYHDGGQYEKALEYFAMALGTYGSLGQAFGQGMTINNLGGVNLVLKRYDDAQKQFTLAVSFFRAAQATSWEAQALENVAAADMALGDKQAAIANYGRALELWQTLEQIERQAMVLNRIAGLHSAGGEAKPALELYSRALILAQKTGNVSLQAGTRIAMGRVYLEAKKWSAAQSEFEEVATLCDEHGDKKGRALAFLELGKLNLAAGENFLQSAAAMFREIGDAAGEKTARELMNGAGREKAAQKKA